MSNIPESCKPKEAAWHRRLRRSRSQARDLITVAAALLEPHHGSTVPPKIKAYLNMDQPDGSAEGDSFQVPGTAFALLNTSENSEQLRSCGCRNQSVCPQCAPGLFKNNDVVASAAGQQGAEILAAMAEG